jgi:molecular chaperone Hsp33
MERAEAREPAGADDLIQPFQIDRHGLRGRLIRLGPAVAEVLDRHRYPATIAHLLGEALALAACLAASLKFDGLFSLQAKGDGPVRMLIADVTAAGRVRGYANFDADGLAALLASESQPTAARLFGGGHLAFTADRLDIEHRYQGIVSLDGATLAECVHHYFRQSEQIETAIRVACGRPNGRDWRAGALMVQRLPEQRGASDESSDEGWIRALSFLATAGDAELIDPNLTPHHLLYRLFQEDGVRVYTPQALAFGCRCSRDRIERVLRSFPRGEIEPLKVDGEVRVTCEFCGATERFSDLDLAKVYRAPA